MVLGHERCGAVKAVYDSLNGGAPLPKHLDAIERGLRTAIEPIVARKGSLDAAVRANVAATVRRISTADSIIEPALERHQIRIVGAEYRLATGAVELLSLGV